MLKKYTKIAAKKGRNFCDELWAIMVKMKYNHRCPICVSNGITDETELANAHHLISRRVFKYRWNTDNGILLCPKHHEFDLLISAHTAPWAFEEWLIANDPDKHGRWSVNRKDIASEGKAVYDVTYFRLEEEYKAITGDYYRLARITPYVLFQNQEQILFASKMSNKSSTDIANDYQITKTAVDKFLKSN
tara:strand:+ start:14172 stop:14741 length:570 start_codon:yes stop_codon:yes gene_type:complete